MLEDVILLMLLFENMWMKKRNEKRVGLTKELMLISRSVRAHTINILLLSTKLYQLSKTYVSIYSLTNLRIIIILYTITNTRSTRLIIINRLKQRFGSWGLFAINLYNVASNKVEVEAIITFGWILWQQFSYLSSSFSYWTAKIAYEKILSFLLLRSLFEESIL